MCVYTYVRKKQFQRSGFHEHSATCSRRNENVEMMSLPEFYFEVETQQASSPSSCRQFTVNTESCLLFRYIYMYRGIRTVANIHTYIDAYI